MQKLILSAILPAMLCGAAHAQLSERVVELDTSGRGKVVSAVTYTMEAHEAVDNAAFNDLAQECVVRNIKFEAFQARDSARSFVGPYTGRYYQLGDTSVYDGDNDVIAFVSSTKPLVVGRGRESVGGITGRIIQYTVAVSASDSEVSIAFEDIKQAHQNTGTARNDGFNNLYQSWGSGYKKAYEGLDGVAAELARCMG